MSNKTKLLDFTGQHFHVGIDVHNSNWKVAVRSNGTFLKRMSVDPTPQVLFQSLQNAFPGGTFSSVYEAGFSGFWAHRELVRLGIRNIIVNPADVPTSDKEKERKSDGIDCNKLSRELENGSLKGIYIPTEEQEGLRSLSRLLEQYRKRSTQIKNRIKGFIHFVGGEIPDHDETSHWSNAFIAYLKAMSFRNTYNREILDVHIEELLMVRLRKLGLIRRIRGIAAGNEMLQLLRSIPGVGLLTAFALYAELYDIYRFNNFDALASFVGISPTIVSSDTKVTVKGITPRHAKYLRYLVIESAWHAVRKDPVLAKAYLDFCKRMPKQKAIIRIAKKLLNRIRYVWKNKIPYEIGIIE